MAVPQLRETEYTCNLGEGRNKSCRDNLLLIRHEKQSRCHYRNKWNGRRKRDTTVMDENVLNRIISLGEKNLVTQKPNSIPPHELPQCISLFHLLGIATEERSLSLTELVKAFRSERKSVLKFCSSLSKDSFVNVIFPLILLSYNRTISKFIVGFVLLCLKRYRLIL